MPSSGAVAAGAEAVEAILFETVAIALAEGGDKIFVDHSSIHPDATVVMASRLQAANGMRWTGGYLKGEAPMS